MNISNLFKICLLCVLIISLSGIYGYGQSVIPDEYLTEKDLKQKAGAEKSEQEAANLFQEAESIYSRLNNLKKEGKLDNDSNKIKELRIEALNKDIEGLERKKEANQLLFKIYKRHLKKLDEQGHGGDMNVIKSHLRYEKAREYFYRASTLRNETYNQGENLEEKFQKLKRANDMEEMGINRIKTAVKLLYAESGEETAESSEAPQKGKKVLIDKKLLGNIKTVLRNYNSETTLYGELKRIRLHDTLTFDKIQTLIKNQRNSKVNNLTAGPESMQQATIKNDSVLTNNRDSQTSIGTETFGNDSLHNSKKTDSSNNDLTYRVHIASEKHNLSQNTLKNLYNEDKEILEIKENGWKKYSIGDFASFSRADHFRKDLNVENAFIVANKDGNQVSADEIEKGGRQFSPVKKKEDPGNTADLSSSDEKQKEIVFKVQIAADKKPLPKEKLETIYGGDKKINMDKVEGWYKYSLGSFAHYREAEQLRKNVNVAGAFVTAYRGNKLLDLWKARNKKQSASKKTNTSSAASLDVIYRVQIAADRIQLESSKISSIYSGTKRIHLNKGEGWYRYSIGNCPTYYHARRLKKHVHVKGSFVVAYRGGERLNAYNMKTYPRACAPLTISRKNPEQDGVVFKVQIVASVLQLSPNDLKYIYCGDKKVTEVKEGKYYKYSIGNFGNYQDAADLKKKVCVPGTFVVAFKNGQPIKVQSAIKQSK